MKKERDDSRLLSLKITRIMKITAILILAGILQVSAVTYAQEHRISVAVENGTFYDVVSQIEKQSEFMFFYKSEEIDNNQRINLKVKDKLVSEILSEITKNNNLTYKITGKHIIITKATTSSQAPRKITGIITDENGEPIVGANIMEKGTTNGTITDIDGRFSLDVSDKAVLVISYIGYDTQNIPVTSKNIYTIKLVEDAKVLEEVVVTAYGIKKSKRALTYSTEQVNMENINSVKSVNLGDALNGKIAGVAITSGSGGTGVGASPRIDIRGNRTINGNNQPLVVVDGVVYGTSGDALSSLNSEDIESMNVLKGPSAAALYGSAANNGVIVITTKQGSEGKSKLEFNSSTIFDVASWFPEMQNEYAQGMGGIYNPNVDKFSWGPKIEGQTVKNWTGEDIILTAQPNNVKDLFRTGLNTTNSLSYSGGNKKTKYYFSYMNTTAKGILETNDLVRNVFNTRITAEVIKNVTIDTKFTYTGNSIENTPEGGDGLWSPVNELYKMPRTLRTQDLQQWYYIDENGNTRQNTWAPGVISIYNPYFSLNARQNPSTSNSMHSIASIRWDIIDGLYVQARGNMNQSSSDSELKIMWDAPYINGGKGDYQTSFSKHRQLIGDVLVSFDRQISKDFRFSANLGAEIKDNYARSQSSKTNGLVMENKFALNNGVDPTTEDQESHIQRQSVYGTIQLGYKNMLYLDATTRGEWSSTLPAPHGYAYPSVGLTAIVSDMVKLPKQISFLKLRGSWAEVGNDVAFASIYQTYNRKAQFPLGNIYLSNTKVASDLKPERTRSLEFGGELKLFENRFGIDITWYKSNSFNQLISISTPTASGFEKAQVNCGNIQNKGIEVMLSAKVVETKDFTYNAYLTFNKNINLIKELYDGVTEVVVGTPELSLGKAYAMVGRPYGELFCYGLQRTDNGDLIISESGLPISSNSPTSYYLGNQNYDWRSSLINNFRYKNWTLSFLIDLNVGGVRQSATESVMLVSGTSKASLAGREDGLIIPGVVDNGNGEYIPNTKRVDAYEWANFAGGRNSFGELYNYSATNSRLRELSVGYMFNLKENYIVKNLHLSLVGKNLFYFYNGCKWFDPDHSSDTSTNGQGSEVSSLPQTRSFGFNVKAIF